MHATFSSLSLFISDRFQVSKTSIAFLLSLNVHIYTSVKIIQLNEYGCRDAPCEKSWKQGNPLSNTIKDTSTIMRNPLSELCREGYDCASILDSIAKGISLFPRFFALCIPTSILNDCSTYFSWFAHKRSYNEGTFWNSCCCSCT